MNILSCERVFVAQHPLDEFRLPFDDNIRFECIKDAVSRIRLASCLKANQSISTCGASWKSMPSWSTQPQHRSNWSALLEVKLFRM